MYRPKHTVSKRRAGRILRGIYACFFAALVIAFLMMPSGNVKAAGGGKGYPVDAFNGVWNFTEKEYNDRF